jgi:hypothetical protein
MQIATEFKLSNFIPHSEKPGRFTDRNAVMLCAGSIKILEKSLHVNITQCSLEDSELLQNCYSSLHEVSQKKINVIQNLGLIFVKDFSVHGNNSL